MNQNCKTITTLLPCAGLLYIENKKLLLAYSKNKQCFYLPGGKIGSDETAAAALCREVLEEMNVAIDENELQFYTHITAPAYGETEGIVMEQDCFLLNKSISPMASAEITTLHFFSLEEYLQEKQQAPGAVLILQQLKSAGYII
jgi:8-oxo-dGTP pyrophosphatase MutT (NUDIX family)